VSYLLNFVLTKSMEQSPSWETDISWIGQEIPHLLCNPKVHYRVPKIPPINPILSYMNPGQTFTTYFITIHLSIILIAMHRSRYFSSLQIFQLKCYVHFSHSTCALHISPISAFLHLITLIIGCLVKSANYEVPIYEVLCLPLAKRLPASQEGFCSMDFVT
jgi:hypothetical protein